MIKMIKQNLVFKSKKTWLATGMLLSLAIIGVGGCGSANTSSTTSSTTPSTTQSTSQSATQSTSSSQPSQGQTTQKTAQNPALRAVMEISRLERNQENPLTSDQKTKLKPILQTLISTSSPSQDFLQQQADAISAVFTDQQKTLLATPRTSNKNQQNATNSNQNSTGRKNSQTEASNKQGGNAPNPQELYQRVLDSL